MFRKLTMLTTTVLLLAVTAESDESVTHTPEQVLERSVAYHDPNGVWDTGRTRIGVHTVYSEAFMKSHGAENADLIITMAPGLEEFEYVKQTAGDKIEITLRAGQGATLINGSTTVSDEDKERLRLRDPGMYRDYCEYLYGMPMKLRDPGTILDSGVKQVKFNGNDVLQVRATYDPDVGKDIWYFYFDTQTFALVGYRFYHDESKNDGEYITLEGEIVDETSGLRLPKTRAWYYNADDGHLATDDIMSIQTS